MDDGELERRLFTPPTFEKKPALQPVLRSLSRTV
jgi:hypothetical protein